MAATMMPAPAADDPLAPGHQLPAETPGEKPPTPPPLTRLPTLSPELEASLVAHVRNLFYTARAKRRPVVAKWDQNYRVVFRRQWNPNRAPHLPRPEVSEVFATLDTLVGWTTDQQPTFDCAPAVEPFHPNYPLASQLAQDLRTTIRASWQVDQTDAEIEKVVWDGFMCGIGYLKTTWDGSAYRGFGNARTVRVDPYTLYPDPDARSMDDCNYFIEARTMSQQEMERRWPGSVARTNGGWLEDADKSPHRLDTTVTGQRMANPGAITPATVPAWGKPGAVSTTPDVTEEPGVTVLEAWLRTPKTEGDRTFDSWRCLVVAGNRVLMDKMAGQLWSHGQHPYDRYVAVETGEFYGPALVEDLAPLQTSINKLLAAMEHNIWLTGNPVLKEDTRAGLSRTAITNQPGQRLPVNQGGMIDWMTPPVLNVQQTMDLIRYYTSEIERISGLSAVVRGASPTGRNAQGVIDAVQEAAFVRIRKSLRGLSRCIGSAGEKMAAMVVEFYDAPRMVTFMGPSGEKTALHLRSQHFYLPSPQGKTPMRFQLLIDAGEASSQSRGQRITEADTLFAMGALDEEGVLEAHAFPNWQQVVQRLKHKQASGEFQPPNKREAARR